MSEYDVLKITAVWTGHLHENHLLKSLGMCILLCYPGGHKPGMPASVITDVWESIQRELSTLAAADKSTDVVGHRR
jgi:hypothetical protein